MSPVHTGHQVHPSHPIKTYLPSHMLGLPACVDFSLWYLNLSPQRPLTLGQAPAVSQRNLPKIQVLRSRPWPCVKIKHHHRHHLLASVVFLLPLPCLTSAVSSCPQVTVLLYDCCFFSPKCL